MTEGSGKSTFGGLCPEGGKEELPKRNKKTKGAKFQFFLRDHSCATSNGSEAMSRAAPSTWLREHQEKGVVQVFIVVSATLLVFEGQGFVAAPDGLVVPLGDRVLEVAQRSLLHEHVEGAAPGRRHEQRRAARTQQTIDGVRQRWTRLVEEETVGAEDQVVGGVARMRGFVPAQNAAGDVGAQLVLRNDALHVGHGGGVAVGEVDVGRRGRLGHHQAGQARHAAAKLQHASPGEQRGTLTQAVVRQHFF